VVVLPLPVVQAVVVSCPAQNELATGLVVQPVPEIHVQSYPVEGEPEPVVHAARFWLLLFVQ
jgi:hypothetical protein